MPKGNLYDRARLNLSGGGAFIVLFIGLFAFARGLILKSAASGGDSGLVAAGGMIIVSWLLLAVGVGMCLVGIVDLVQAAREPWFIADATDDERDVVARGAYERARPPV